MTGRREGRGAFTALPPAARLGVGLGLALALGACRGKPAPKLEVSATWIEAPSPPGCVRHLLRLDVATIAHATVRAAQGHADADEDGHARLELRRAGLGTTGRLVVRIADGETELAIPAAPADDRPIVLDVDDTPSPGDPDPRLHPPAVVWRGRATGAVVAGIRAEIGGVLDGTDLRLRFIGCDLRGGSVADGSVSNRDPDRIEVRYPLVARLAAATTLAPMTAPMTFEVGNTSGVRGAVTLAGQLDVPAALAALQAAAGGTTSAAAAPWQPGARNSILVTGPGLDDAADLARADRLLAGAPVGRAAAVLLLTVRQVASDARCVGRPGPDGAAPSWATTRAEVAVTLVERATGQVRGGRSFEHEAACPPTLPAAADAVVAATPPWPDILTWAEAQAAGTPPP